MAAPSSSDAGAKQSYGRAGGTTIRQPAWVSRSSHERREGRMHAPARTVPVFQLLASLVLIIASLYWARTVFIPVALALLLTFLLNPIASALQRRGLRRTPSVILVVLLLFSCLGGIGWAITAEMTTLAAELPHYEDNIRQKIADIRWAG